MNFLIIFCHVAVWSADLIYRWSFRLRPFISKLFAFLLKLSRNKKDFINVTAAPFSVFFAAGSWEKDTENRAAVTSLRSFLFHDDFIKNL